MLRRRAGQLVSIARIPYIEAQANRVPPTPSLASMPSLPLYFRCLSAVAVSWLSGCAARHAADPLPPEPHAIEGRIIGQRYFSGATGPGGLQRIEIALTRTATSADLPPRAYVRVDSATRFAVVTGGIVDWRLPSLPFAYVRVWFRGPHSNPTHADFFGDARIIAIDSIPCPVAR